MSFEKAELQRLMRRLPALDGKEPQSNIECVIEVLHALIDLHIDHDPLQRVRERDG